MKIIITEKQFQRLLKEGNLFTDKINSIYRVIKDTIKGNYKIYKDVIPGIADRYYGKETIKSDAFRHILASAFFTTTIGGRSTWLGGQVNELAGALKNFLSGGDFDSGWEMDTKNNDIGILLGKKYPEHSIEELSIEVKKIIDDGNFYTKKGILFKNDPKPEF